MVNGLNVYSFFLFIIILFMLTTPVALQWSCIPQFALTKAFTFTPQYADQKVILIKCLAQGDINMWQVEAVIEPTPQILFKRGHSQSDPIFPYCFTKVFIPTVFFYLIRSHFNSKTEYSLFVSYFKDKTKGYRSVE